MSFNAKVILSVAALVAVALGVIFLFRSSEEKAIENLLEQGLESAQRGDAEAVIALLSPHYQNGTETLEGISRKIRQAVSQRITPAKLQGVVVQVSGDDADASVTVVVGAFRYQREFGLRLKFRKEDGVWKVTSAEESGR